MKRTKEEVFDRAVQIAVGLYSEGIGVGYHAALRGPDTATLEARKMRTAITEQNIENRAKYLVESLAVLIEHGQEEIKERP